MYQLGAGDVLGVYIEGVLGKIDESPPITQGWHPLYSGGGGQPLGGGTSLPALGFPLPIREDGTISLPLAEPIELAGLTLAQAEEEIRQEYTVRRRILLPGRDRIIITLIEPRKYTVIVVREDGVGPEGRPLQYAAFQFSPTGSILEPPKMGITQQVELKAYENDVLHALAKSGGLPGTAAKAEVKILRGAFKNARERDQYLRNLEDPALRAEIAATNQKNRADSPSGRPGRSDAEDQP